MLKVCAITATNGRHTCLERSVAMFLSQDYTNSIQLIYNNSCSYQRLNSNLTQDRFVLINNCLDYQTGKYYTTLGAIYRDAITHVPEDVDIVCFFDDDDLFHPDHLSEGIKGLEKGGKTAYKPQFSYFKSGKVTSLMENVLEPSIFVKKEHILKYGFKDSTVDQHMGWLQPLIDSGDIYLDPHGKSTLVYTWGDTIPVYKTSGDPHNPHNFSNYKNFSKDEGDGIITPLSKQKIDLNQHV